ncbi:hypothetical protein [Zhongshania sp.]|jgi:hypothetical protein|uniref:hypothetical protein n=1 Tax=Zhongshania sp. TaxID=1971902 RepID=UPI002A81D8AB|nr:hypothetical protein [Zhongshania sp.]
MEKTKLLQRLEGKVEQYRSITKRSVQIELQGIQKVIELTVSEPWVVKRNDLVTVVGETDPKSGKFIGYAYKNSSKGVFGKYDAQVGVGVIFIVAGLLFCWAIFPLFIHIPAGFKAIALGKKVNNAAAML